MIMPAQKPNTSPKVPSLLIVMPAYNEEIHFKNSLKKYKQVFSEIPNSKFIVVNDGSKDKTLELLKKNKITTINSSPKSEKINLGKGQAFLAGAKYAKQHGYKYILTVDADLDTRFLQSEQIKTLLREIQQKGVKQVIARQYERDFPVPIQYCGQRIIEVKALNPLFANNKNWLKQIRGFGLEIALNNLIKSKYFSSTKIVTDAIRSFDQSHDLDTTTAIIEKRMVNKIKLTMIRNSTKRKKLLEKLAKETNPIKKELIKKMLKRMVDSVPIHFIPREHTKRKQFERKKKILKKKF